MERPSGVCLVVRIGSLASPEHSMRPVCGGASTRCTVPAGSAGRQAGRQHSPQAASAVRLTARACLEVLNSSSQGLHATGPKFSAFSDCSAEPIAAHSVRAGPKGSAVRHDSRVAKQACEEPGLQVQQSILGDNVDSAWHRHRACVDNAHSME